MIALVFAGCSLFSKEQYVEAHKYPTGEKKPDQFEIPVVDPVPQVDSKDARLEKKPIPQAVQKKVPNAQLKRLKDHEGTGASSGKNTIKGTPAEVISQANTNAAQKPREEMFINAITVYDYMEGALYQVYCSPGHVTDIMLQPGEVLTCSPASGDTKGWKVDYTTSGVGSSSTVHIFVKPRFPDLQTNMVITTDKHIYHLEIQSLKKAYQAGVSWYYPSDEFTKITNRIQLENEQKQDIVSYISLENLNFDYEVSGKASWKPIRVFDDGHKTFIQFPDTIDTEELPPLFIESYGDKQLVNYRYQKGYYVVDRLFSKALLQLGTDHAEKVYIEKKG